MILPEKMAQKQAFCAMIYILVKIPFSSKYKYLQNQMAAIIMAIVVEMFLGN
jgi:hypothetical protein